MKRILRTIGIVFLFALPAAPVHGQEIKYARVTITNQTRVTILLSAKWDVSATVQEIAIEPGRHHTFQTDFAAGPTKPVLTVRYRQMKWFPRETVRLESGHIDPYTDNPGRVYDFERKRTNEGLLLLLTPR